MNATFRAVCAMTFIVSTALLTISRPVFAQTTQAATNAPIRTVSGQTTWDERYVYLVLTVSDPDVLGTNTLPLSDPQKDDSVAVYIQTGAPTDSADANSHAMIVSAAGGFTFLVGDTATKTLVPKPVYSIKYGVTIQGTLNRSDDTDKGYVVELAIPWTELGVSEATAKAGLPFSMNVVVRDRAGKSFSSLSSKVVAEPDIVIPSKWMPLVVASSESADNPPASIFMPPAPRKGDRSVPPLIDGVLKIAGEWPSEGKFTFNAPSTTVSATAPKEPVTPIVVVPEDKTPPTLNLTADSLKGVEPLVFARYVLSFQGDGRKPTPFVGTFDGRTGHFLMTDDPLSGAGPWFSSDRASWHRTLLYDMRRTGVDSALVSFGGPDSLSGAADMKALYVMTEALREMTQDGLPTPKVALELDTQRLSADGSATDLQTPEGQARLYQAIRRFFAIVPPQFRSRVTLPGVAGGVPGYPVFLSGNGLAGTDGVVWSESLRKEFAEEFGVSANGATLIFVGGTGLDSTKSPGLIAGNVPLTTGGTGTGPLTVSVVQPGIETPASLIPRKNGDTYKASWQAALDAHAKWYVLDSWNDFSRATELVPSRQYGPRYLDLTRINTVQIGNLEGIDLRWRGNDIPRRLRVGQTAPVIVSIQNGGGVALRPEEGYALAYRWKQDGKVVAEAPLRNRLLEPFLPTQTKSFLLGLTSLTVDGSGKLIPLLPGDYTLEVDFLKLKDTRELLGDAQYLSETGIAPLVVPISLYADNRQNAIFEETTTPALLQAGESYPVSVKVRYMGPDDLPAGSAALTWQLVSTDGKNVVATGSTTVNSVLPSGVPITVLANVSLNDSSGLPVPPSFPELPEGRGVAGGGYRLRWLISRTDSTDTIPGEFSEQVAVYAGDEEVRFPLPDRVPESVPADTTFTLTIPVVNRGTKSWTKEDYIVGAHWYYADGMEAQWKPSVTVPLPKTVAPGEEVTIKLTLRAPATEGAYIVVPDIAHVPDDYFSTRPVSRIGDIAPILVRVTGGQLSFVDLTRIFNVDGVASEADPSDGDLDGKGSTFPAESFPPDQFGLGAATVVTEKSTQAGTKKVKSLPAPPYPSGYYADVAPSVRRISFQYGPTEKGKKNAIVCAKQTIAIQRGRYDGLHMAATATGGKSETVPVILNYSDKTSETVTVTVRDWNELQAATSDIIATMTRRKRTASGDQATPCLLRHVIIPTNVVKELESITLPDSPNVKVFAISLHK